jgi:hypothetical protein
VTTTDQQGNNHESAGAPSGARFATKAKAETATKLGALAGTASEVRDRAQEALWQAEVLYQVAGAKAAAQDILAAYPNAAVLELEDNDQEGSSFRGTRILDAQGDHVADFDEFEDEHWAAMTDLPASPRHRTVVNADGTTRDEGDDRFAFLQLEGSRRMGYTGRLDLKLAAAADLSTLGGAR